MFKLFNFKKPTWQTIFFWCIAWILFIVPVAFAMFRGNASIFDLNKLVLIRPLILFLLWLIAFVILKKGSIQINKQAWWLWWWAALIILIVNVLISEVPMLSFIGNIYREQGIYSLVYYWLILGIISWYQPNFTEIEAWFKIILISSSLVVFYGFLQYIGWDPLLWSEQTVRLSSTLGQPDFLAHYLVMIIPVALYLCIASKKSYWRVFSAVLLIAEIFILYRTLSRGAYVALITSVIVGLGVYIVMRKKFIKIFVSILLGLFLLLSLMIAFEHSLTNTKLYNKSVLFQRFVSSFEFDKGGVKIRLLFWQAAGQEFLATDWQHRLLGYGKDTQQIVFSKRYHSDWGVFEKLNSFPDRAHNIIIDAWLEFGLLGMTVFAGLWISIIYGAIKYGREHQEQALLLSIIMAGLGAYIGAGLFSFPLTTHYVYAYFLLGLLASFSVGQIKTFPLFFSQKYWRLGLLLLIAICLSLIAYVYDFRQYLADRFFMKAQIAEANGNFRGLLDNSQAMLSYFPLSQDYRDRYIYFNLNALAVVGTSSMVVATDNIIYELDNITASERKVYNWQSTIAHAYSLLIIYKDKAYYPLAKAAYEQMIKSTPNVITAYQDYGRMEIWAGHQAEAIKIYQQGLKLMPKLDDARYVIGYGDGAVKSQAFTLYNLIGDAYSYKKDWNNAINNYLQAYSINPSQVQNLLSLAQSYQAKKDYKTAIRFAREGKIANPDDEHWYFLIGQLYQQSGDKTNAIKYLKLAKKQDINNKKIDELINKIYTK